MDKKTYFDLSKKLAMIRGEAVAHIGEFLSDGGHISEETAYKCNIETRESFGYGVDLGHVTNMYLEDAKDVRIGWNGDAECSDDIESLSTEEILTILYEIIIENL